MHQAERAQLVARLNLNWPGQQITAQTAAEWFGPLAAFPADEVWDAVDRHRRNISPGRDGLPVGHWRPELADLLAAVDANWRERSAERRELERRAARDGRNGHGGVVMPAETKEALRILEQSKALPGNPNSLSRQLTRIRIEALADQLEERVGLQETGRLT